MKRDKGLDIGAGFGLIIVVFVHIINFCGKPYNLYTVIDCFCFYLAFFYYKAGVCFKPKNLKEIVRTGFNRLIIPYIIFSIIGILCLIIWQTLTIEWMDLITSIKINVKNSFIDTIHYGAPQANLPLWFLPSLFICRILMNIATRKISNKGLLVLLFVIISTMQVIDCIETFDDIPLYFKNIPLGFSIMLIGYLAGRDVKQKYLLASLMIYISILIIYPSHLSIFGGMPYSGVWVTGFVALVTGCISIKGIASLNYVSNNKAVSILEHLGKHSMSYYCLHWIIQLGICYVSIGDNTQPWIRLMCMVIACMLLLPLLDKIVNMDKLKWIIGEK